MPGDLHTHTTFSDGSTPAAKLPFLAKCAGMTHLAISDHDSIRCVRYAYANPVQEGVHLIPATELTAYDYERAHRVHILCYWPDDCGALADFARLMAERRCALDTPFVFCSNKTGWELELLKTDQLFSHLPQITTDVEQRKRFCNGAGLGLNYFSGISINEGDLCRVYDEDKLFLGVGICKEGEIRSRKLFC